jgi:multiple sugar transport system permease protein
VGLPLRPDFGPFAQLAKARHVAGPHFLSERLMLGSIANIVTWEFVGYNMIILYAALRAIPHELYEAAAVDGAGAWRIAWSIKLPALRPALLLCLIFSVIGSFQLFNEPSCCSASRPASSTAPTPRTCTPTTSPSPASRSTTRPRCRSCSGLVIVIVSYAVLLTANRRRTS